MSFDAGSHLRVSDFLTSAQVIGHDQIRAHTRGITKGYVSKAAEEKKLDGRVLDYGCGPQPYKDLVRGEYFAFDPSSDPGFAFRPMPDGLFDAILLTYVLGYTFDPREILAGCAAKLQSGGFLVGAYQISWREIEPSFVCSPTKSGVDLAFKKMERDFDLLENRVGSTLWIGDFALPLSGLFTARKR